jgi:hypothetical protein
VVAVGHGTEFGARRVRGIALRHAFRRAAAVVLVSEYTRRLFLEFDAARRGRRGDPNGADPSGSASVRQDEVARRRERGGIPAADC